MEFAILRMKETGKVLFYPDFPLAGANIGI